MSPDSPFVPGIRDLLLELLIGAGSSLVIVPIQDLFGWTDRVNVPAVVDDRNWTWKLPWALEDLAGDPHARERQSTVARWVRQYGA